ncbi:Cox13 cytochrome c oxidase [Candida orthopsilosis Co 90-125]|uniref:Cytochrome c oxidase subunit n=1 Tax=Candida orthopsilosis (strain 90-125) TaxID=1136231 RepID=H8WWV4_CANO9|nr:Cox13 cytochrome c oxidase [Candida orthopsilosis Co 90-125]CCG21094.1 Cox13 cytochrome c oxidase [Candida orthopsilosis Co 90-125]
MKLHPIKSNTKKNHTKNSGHLHNNNNPLPLLHNTHSTMSRHLTLRRLAHHYAPSKYLNDLAYKSNKKLGDQFIQQYETKVHHSAKITDTWKKLTYLVAIPAILLTAIPVGKVELEHAHHREHTRHLSDDEWPQQYDYQNIRSKPFFWGDGDKTLFWNSDINRHVQKD